MTIGYLESHKKSECFGCEACVQACSRSAIRMQEDEEGFRYPKIDASICTSCGICHTVCPSEKAPPGTHGLQSAFGGYLKDQRLRQESTSGGAFSAIVDGWCDDDYVVFGAAAEGVKVFHCYVTNKEDIGKFRRSKYSQSVMGQSYQEVKRFLREGKKVIFSGTPCQIAGLKEFLRKETQENLLTVEVVCEGLPSPKFIQKLIDHLSERYGCGMRMLDYRNKDKPRWDFNVMKITLENGRDIYIDRWFNPFFTIWIGGLMSRPSCYGCPYTAQTGLADITLADLWGVHRYCPELYGENKGSSLVLCNTQKGAKAFSFAKKQMFGHELDLDKVLSFQRRLKKSIEENPQREAFMQDLLRMDYRSLCKKWAAKPSFQLLWSKYVWGNRQKAFMWNVGRKITDVIKRRKQC